ncbi:hypothetical protein BASA50_005265 [Batrachochytrium salamandrivorans]|uniref:GPI-anchored surface protein n=1 Tax=Batrachochytrium salamandrivorans TaxID=1357716 RepID=A0ABQ8FG98_9FUNG|nr:hypothetical protein BASA50_005265 [Batrachochytrium salamandrivorans]
MPRKPRTREQLFQCVQTLASQCIGSSTALHDETLVRIVSEVVYGTTLQSECTLRRVLKLGESDRLLWTTAVLTAALTQNGLHDDAEAIEEYAQMALFRDAQQRPQRSTFLDIPCTSDPITCSLSSDSLSLPVPLVPLVLPAAPIPIRAGGTTANSSSATANASVCSYLSVAEIRGRSAKTDMLWAWPEASSPTPSNVLLLSPPMRPNSPGEIAPSFLLPRLSQCGSGRNGSDVGLAPDPRHSLIAAAGGNLSTKQSSSSMSAAPFPLAREWQEDRQQQQHMQKQQQPLQQQPLQQHMQQHIPSLLLSSPLSMGTVVDSKLSAPKTPSIVPARVDSHAPRVLQHSTTTMRSGGGSSNGVCAAMKSLCACANVISLIQEMHSSARFARRCIRVTPTRMDCSSPSPSPSPNPNPSPSPSPISKVPHGSTLLLPSSSSSMTSSHTTTINNISSSNDKYKSGHAVSSGSSVSLGRGRRRVFGLLRDEMVMHTASTSQLML